MVIESFREGFETTRCGPGLRAGVPLRGLCACASPEGSKHTAIAAAAIKRRRAISFR